MHLFLFWCSNLISSLIKNQANLKLKIQQSKYFLNKHVVGTAPNY